MTAATLRALGRLFLLYDRSPSYILLFVTGRCEATCPHCFYWNELNRSTPELTLGQIEQFARRTGPVVQVTLTGGSPELRSDLADIAMLIATHCAPVNITLCSNGNYPAKLHDDVRRVLEAHPGVNLTVDISLDALHEENDALRGIDGLFDRVVESYALLAPLRSRHRGLRLGCGICVSGVNKHSALATARWAMENLPLDNFTPILIRGNPRRSEASATDSEVFLRIASEVEHRLKGGAFRGYAGFSRIINWKDIIQKRLIHDIYVSGASPIRCSAARETAVVYPDGTVGGCEIRSEVLGHLPDVGMDIRAIWRSRAAREFRKAVAAERCVCHHQCFLSPTIVKSPALLFRY